MIKITSTFFFVGYFPFIPGTFASIFAVFLFYLIKGNFLIHLALLLSLMLLGFSVIPEAINIFQKKDPRHIVIDEIVGMLLSLIFIPYNNFGLLISAFLIFRIFDTFKPYPTCKFQEIKGALGIMGDDIIAGLSTNIILQVARFVSLKIS